MLLGYGRRTDSRMPQLCASDAGVRSAATDETLGQFDILTNNCCHWARAVIERAGLKWPYADGELNYGMN